MRERKSKRNPQGTGEEQPRLARTEMGTLGLGWSLVVWAVLVQLNPAGVSAHGILHDGGQGPGHHPSMGRGGKVAAGGAGRYRFDQNSNHKVTRGLSHPVQCVPLRVWLYDGNGKQKARQLVAQT